MPVNILILPGNARAKSKILRYLDDQSILRLREVCKIARTLANLSIVLNEKTIVRSFSCEMRKLYGHRLYVVLTFYFGNRGKCALWRSVLNCIMKQLKMPNFFINQNCTFLNATMKPDQVENFFDYMKPLIGVTEFLELTLSDCSDEMIRICSEFVVGKTIREISITCKENKSDFNSYLNLVRDCRTDHLIISPYLLTKECIGWLSQFSTVVSTLSISARRSKITNIGPLVTIRALLSVERSKCSEIHIFYVDVSLSFADVQNMIKLLHSSNKKIYVNSLFKDDHIDLQVGLYHLKTFHIQTMTDVTRFIVIKPLQAQSM